MKDPHYPSQNTLLINESPALIFIADLNSRNIQWCNKTTEDILGYSLKEMQKMKNKLFKNIIHPEDFQGALVTRHLLLSGENKHETICRFREKKHEWRWFYGIAKVHRQDVAGKAQTAFCIFLEVNESDAVSQKAFRKMIYRPQINTDAIKNLSCHQKDLLPYIAEGLSDQEIASIFNNSVGTIETHVKNIRKSFNIHSRIKLVVLLIEMGYQNII